MKPWLKVLLWIIVIGGLVGGSTYCVVNSKAKQDKNNLQTQIDALNIKLTAAQKSLTDAQAKTTTTTTSTPAATAATPAVTPTVTTTWKSYSNTTYSFSLTLPNDSWKNYSVKQVTPTDKSATKYLYLCLTTTDKSWTDSCDSGQFGPVAIGVYSKAQWDTIKNDDTPESNSKIAENSTYVFTYSHSQALPTDFENTDLGLTSLQSSFKAN